MANDLTGIDFGYLCVPSEGASCGIIVAWDRSLWAASQTSARVFSASIRLRPAQGDDSDSWWLTVVYGPTLSHLKSTFLQELRDVRAVCPGPWLVCGDFSMILHAADKNNDGLHRGLMRRFQHVVDELELAELQLTGRLYTWSNERDSPTLERLDRAFGSVDWMARHPTHALRAVLRLAGLAHLEPAFDAALIDWWLEARS